MSKSKYYTVVKITRDTEFIESRIASFTEYREADRLAEIKNSRVKQGDLFHYEVVYGDLYSEISDYLQDEKELLLKSARIKLTEEEWCAVTNSSQK